MPDNVEQAKATVDRMVEVIRLAKMPPLDAETEIKAAAKRLGVTATVLRKEVEKGRRKLEESNKLAQSGLVELVVHDENLPRTTKELAKLFRDAGRLYEREGEGPCTLHYDPGRHGDAMTIAHTLDQHGITMEAHEICQPIRWTKDEGKKGITLPETVAAEYLTGLSSIERGLRWLAGIAVVPKLSDDGRIECVEGYDADTRCWYQDVPRPDVPEAPSREEAEDALLRLRAWFRSFPFADAATRADNYGIDWPFRYATPVVDLDVPAGINESSFLASLLTAVARPSLWVAPAILLNAPNISGSGTGKGLLYRSISMIAYGLPPRNTTYGHSDEEFDKRLVSLMLTGAPAVYMENVNARLLRSDTLASVVTDRPSHVRKLGLTGLVPMEACSLIGLNGNGLTLTEDLVGRFLQILLDANVEDARDRDFPCDPKQFLNAVKAARTELLGAILTIWRWGRQQKDLPRGKPAGGFEQWSRWCRDPLLALGCADPIEQVRAARAADPDRERLITFFGEWNRRYGSTPQFLADVFAERDIVLAYETDEPMSRQAFAGLVNRHLNATLGGYKLVRNDDRLKRGANRHVATYSVIKVEE